MLTRLTRPTALPSERVSQPLCQRTRKNVVVNRVIFGLAAVLMLSACDSSANKACPGAGNAGPGVSVGVYQLATRYPSGIRVTLCVSGECRTEATGPKTSPSAVSL